jgi:hypothetical protein
MKREDLLVFFSLFWFLKTEWRKGLVIFDKESEAILRATFCKFSSAQILTLGLAVHRKNWVKAKKKKKKVEVRNLEHSPK